MIIWLDYYITQTKKIEKDLLFNSLEDLIILLGVAIASLVSLGISIANVIKAFRKNKIQEQKSK